MPRPRLLPGLLAAAMACGLAATALADDLNPPAYRGINRSTSAEWDFNTDQPNPKIQPDGSEVALVVGDMAPALNGAFPASAPHPSCSRSGGVSWTTVAGDTGYLGGPAGTGAIACNVPNWFDSEPEKQVRIQVTYSGTRPTTAIFGFLGVPGTSSTVEEVFIQRVSDTAQVLPSGASYFYEDWRLFPNPDWEQVVVFLPADTFLHQLVIDTVSGPLSGDLPIFNDGFETGDTSRWSLTFP